MFWIRSGLQSISISDWLTAGPAVAADPANGLEDAREALFEALGDAGGRKRATLQLRIRNAADVHVLWALRPEIMEAVAHLYGEAEGRKRLARATDRFEGLVPASALTSARRRHRMAPASP
jgi:hypothetical protein